MIQTENNNPAPRNAIAENVARNETMSSIELLELVNHERAQFGETEVRHNDFVARCRDELEGEYYESFVVKTGARGRPAEAIRMTADQCKLVAMRESKGVRRNVLARLKDLASGVRSMPASEKLAGELAIMECFSRLLNPAPSSRVMMLAKIAKQNGLDAQFLPAYAVDAAANSTEGSSMPTKALTALLKEHGIKCAPAAFNDRLAEAGILARLTRRNSKGETVGFWSITPAGLEYGKNLTSPASPRETQPHWYVERFPGLLSLVLGRRVA